MTDPSPSTTAEELADGAILFTTWLDNLHGGIHSISLTNAMAGLVEGVKRYKAKGRMTLTIDIEPATDDAGMVAVACEVTTKAPKAPVRKAILYVDEIHNLVPDDPYARRLDLRDLTRNPTSQETNPS